MNPNSVGSIEYQASIDTSRMKSGAAETESIVQGIGNTGSATFKNFAGNAGKAFDSVAAGIATLAKVSAGVFIGGAFGVKNFVDLAGELQNTNQSMGVLIGSTEKANKVFGELYNYTLGKPIAFPTAAAAAKTLAGYGVEADNVVGSMKDLSAISIVTGGDLNSLALAYGQVNSRGKLMGQETLQLVNQSVPIVKILAAHFHKSLTDMAADMEGGTVSAQDFNDALHEYANTLDITKFGNTFKNRMISLQGSIRSVGLAILGVRVDSERGLIVDQSGLFAKVSSSLEDMAKWLKENKETIVGVAKVMIDNAIPAITGIAAAFTVAKLAAIGFAIATSPIDTVFFVVAAAITALVATLTFLQVKFNIFGKTWDFIKQQWGNAGKFFQDVFTGVEKWVKDAQRTVDEKLQDIKKIADDVFGGINKWLKKNDEAIKTTATILGVLFGPALVKAGVEAVVAGVKIVGSAIVSGGAWTAAAIASAAAWVVNTAKMIVASTLAGISSAKDAIVASAAWVANAVVASGAWLLNMAKVSASLAATAVVAAVKAADAGYAWVINAARVSLVWVTQELPKIVAAFVTTATSAVIQAAAASAAWIANAVKTSVAWVITELPKIIAAFIVTSASAVAQAAASSAAWIASAAASSAAWVITELPKIIAAFVAMAASATVNAGVASAAWVGAAAAGSASFSALAALVAVPIVMPALVVAAALASLALVYQAVQSIIGAVDAMKSATEAAKRDLQTTRDILTKNAQVQASGVYSADYKDKYQKVADDALKSDAKLYSNYGGFASGGSVSAGVPIVVGENPDGSLNKTSELFVPRSSGTIMNSKDLQSALGGNSSGLTNNIGTVIVNNKADADYLLSRLTRETEIYDNGSTPVRKFA